MATAKKAAKKTPSKKTAHRNAASTSKKTSARRGSKPDALGLLRSDHEEVTALFDRFESAKRLDQKEKLAQTICRALKVHARIEEEIFYPALREARGDEETEDMLNEADVEHSGAKKLIAEIEGSGADDPLFEARVKVLSEYIRHHVKEEQGDLFKAARDSDLDLVAIGEALAARKKELLRDPGA
ncbi:MAG: hemerythrin domain-containing protein [Tahibacter sp.]